MRPFPRALRRLAFAALLMVLVPPSPRADGTSVLLQREYEAAALRVQPAADGLMVTLRGLASLAQPGRPDLPVDRVTVEPPPGMRVAEVHVRTWEEMELPVPGAVRPYRGSPGYEDGGITRDPDVYDAAEWFPAARVVVRSPGALRGRRLETIEIHPVRVLPQERRLRVAKRVFLEITFAPDLSGEVTRPRNVAWPDPGPFPLAVAKALGKESPAPSFPSPRLSPLVNGIEPFSPRFLPSEEGSPVRYLIVTSDAMDSTLQVLADWKTALGMPTVVRTTSWIYENYPRGVDHAEDLRDFIREAIEKWGVEYVLLAGDTEVMPFRYGKSYFYGGELIPTDMYFQCVDGTWNNNGDDLFGEGYVNSNIPGDQADLYPDVWLGRAPLRTPDEAGAWVEKVITYESAAPTGSGFADQVLALGEVLFPQNWSEGDTVIFDGAQLCETALAYLNDSVTDYRMYENTNEYPGSVLLYKDGAIQQINSGYNLILHVGHGYRNTMAMGQNGETIVNADADAFHNGAAQGLLYAINCTSSAFDFDCIAEHLVRNARGGVISSVGSTRYDFPSTGWHYQDEFFSLLYDDGVTRLGETAAMQKIPFISNSVGDGEDRWTQFSLLYMGDPTLDLYTGPLDMLQVTAPDSVVLGDSTCTVLVSDSQGPVEGATVCLNKADDSYGIAVTDASGQAVVPFHPDFPGRASLGVRVHDHLCRVDTLDVVSPGGAHLFVAQTAVDDTTGGDGDGFLEAGETALLVPVIGNQGLSPAAGVVLTVVQNPPEVTVLDGTASCAEVLADSSAACADPLELALAPDIGDVTALSLTVRLTAAGYTRDEPLVLYVGAPHLVIQTTTVQDTAGSGNGNGVVDPGEDQVVLVRLKNLGLGRATGVEAVLSSTDPAVEIVDGSSAYGDLEAEATGEGDGFLLRFSDGSLDHPLHLAVNGAQGTALDFTVNLAPPATTTGLLANGGTTSIELSWDPNEESDLAGYHVYRAPAPGGPYEWINMYPPRRTSYYRDEDLPPLTRYYYRVAAVDSAGVEGPWSGEAQATTSLIPKPGFPRELGAATSSSPCLAYLNGDTKGDIVTGADEIYAVLDDGTEYMDGDNDTRTYGVFSASGFGPYWSPPAVGDLDHDGVQEIVGATWESGLLYVWDSHDGAWSGWPKSLAIGGHTPPHTWSAPVLADVDGDGHLEIFINAGQYTFAFHDDGTELADGDGDPSSDGVLLVMGQSANYGTPAVADVDRDGIPEIIVGSRDGNLYVVHPDGTPLPGFPFASGGEITNSPAVGDLDNDGWKEIIFANSVYQVFALNANLEQPPGWPQAANMNLDYDASPALADMDGDGYLDVVLCAGNGTVYLWHGQNGQLFPGWGFVLRDANGDKVGLSSSPAVGNLDPDPEYEICFGGNDGNLYAFNVDATLVNGFPIGTSNLIEGGPLLWDLDNDGYTDVVAQSQDQNLYVWESPGPFDPDNQPWPMFHHDSHRTGNVDDTIWVETGVPGGDPSPGPGFLLAPGTPNPFSSSTTITYRIPDTKPGGMQVSLAIFDAKGRRVTTLVHGVETPGFHTLGWDGTDDAGRRVAGGVYFYRLQTEAGSRTRKLVLLR